MRLIRGQGTIIRGLGVLARFVAGFRRALEEPTLTRVFAPRPLGSSTIRYFFNTCSLLLFITFYYFSEKVRESSIKIEKG